MVDVAKFYDADGNVFKEVEVGVTRDLIEMRGVSSDSGLARWIKVFRSNGDVEFIKGSKESFEGFIGS